MDQYKEFRESKSKIHVCGNVWNRSITFYFKKGTYEVDGENIALTIDADSIKAAIDRCVQDLK